MFTPAEREEITSLVHQEIAVLAQLRKLSGSYTYQCILAGEKIFTHQPVGTVLHIIPRF